MEMGTEGSGWRWGVRAVDEDGDLGQWVEMGPEGSGWRWGLRAVGGDGE